MHCGGAVAVAEPGPAPRTYTPPHLADKILTMRSALEGERKQVSVLFADVKGSVKLSEQIDAEEWHRVLDRFFKILAQGIHRFEGTINQFTGDGIMALFGAPIAHEDHAQRACFAALHLQRALKVYADEVRRVHGLNFRVRMGLNSGEVVVGRIGDDLRMDYTAQGLQVGLAARVQELAASDRIYLAPDAASLVEGYFDLENLGSFDLKGIGGEVDLFELKGPGELRSRLDLSRARGFSDFLGREDEMQVLEGALSASLEGRAQLVAFVGEAGVGKSRLCYEFLERCRARGIPCTQTRGVSHGRTISLLPILDLYREALGVREHETPRECRERMRELGTTTPARR
jgi:class 3 adenylate cyclase